MIPTPKQICKKCLIPDTYPNTHLNKDGICNHCGNYKKQQLLGEDLFLKKINSEKGNKYDCVLGISGGKDSCYVAYLAKKIYNFRVIAVCYDFPFLCDLARQNIKNVCSNLDLELIILKTKNNLEYDLLRNHLISLVATGTTWGQCIFCHYGIDAILSKIADKKKIPFILSGVQRNELWNPGNRTQFLFNRVKKLPLKEISNFIYFQFKAFLGLIDQRIQFKMPPNNCLNVYKEAKKPLNGPEFIRVFDYIKWDHKEIEKILISETGWKKPKKMFSWRYDCILEPLQDYTYLQEFGISTVGLYTSGLIRDGLISKDEALKIQKQSENPETLRSSVELVFNYLNISPTIQQKFFNS